MAMEDLASRVLHHLEPRRQAMLAMMLARMSVAWSLGMVVDPVTVDMRLRGRDRSEWSSIPALPAGCDSESVVVDPSTTGGKRDWRTTFSFIPGGFLASTFF